jgi:hypothetical protein
MAGCGWTKTLAVALLLIGAGRLGFTQSDRGSSVPRESVKPGLAQPELPGTLVGKLTDLNSKPLEGVAIVARNQATGAEARTITGRNGVYRLNGLAPGEYTVEAESPQLGRGQVEDIVVGAGHVARVQTAILFVPPAPGIDLATARGPNPPQPPQPGLSQPALDQIGLKQLGLKQPGRVEPGLNRPNPVRPALDATALPVSETALASESLQTLTLTAPFWQVSAPPAPAVSSAKAVASPSLRTNSNGTQATAEARAPLAGSGQTFSKRGTGSGANTSLSARPNSSGAAREAGETAQTMPRPASPAEGADRTEQSGSSAGSSKPGAAAAQAVAQPAPPPQSPVLAASRKSGPVAPAVTTTISSQQLQALPVSGRHWEDFVLDSAPTSVTPASGQGQISLRGAGQQPAAIAVDGMDTGMAFGPTGGTSGSGQGSSGRGALGQGGVEPAGIAQVGMGGHGLSLSEAAVREVQTIVGNVEAGAASAAGGRLNVETMSGGNELHGRGFIFDRQNNWGARNPFTQWVKETAPATLSTIPVFTPESYTPENREMTWGIGAGSRIRSDKLFWFAALDGSRRNNPGLSMVRIPEEFFAQPSNDQMQVLSARLGLSSINPVAEGLAKYSSMLEELGGLLGPAPRTASQWTGFGRVDWKASERQSFTLEGFGARWNSPGGGMSQLSESYGNHSFGSTAASKERLLGRWAAFLTPNLLSVARFSEGGTIRESRPETPSAFEQTFLAGNAWGQLPQIVVDSGYGMTIGNPSRFGTGSYPDERTYQGQESLDWVHGNLLVKAGFEASHNADATSLLRNQTGTYSYQSVENFASDALVFGAFGPTDALDPNNQHNCDETGRVWRDSGGNLRGLGNLPCYSYYSQTIGPAGWHVSTNNWAGYATAQWQAGKQLVVSAGLRWEREQLPPPIAALWPPPPVPSATSSPQRLPSLGNEWGPRVSLAVGRGEGDWPVLRLGYGMYYGRTSNLAVETALTQTGSMNGDLHFFIRPTDDLPNNGGGAPPFPHVLTGEPLSVVKPGAVEFAPNFRNPEVHQAVISLEKELPGSVVVTGSGMVSLGRRLPISIDTNLGPPTPLQTITYQVCDQTPSSLNESACGFLGLGPIKTPTITVPYYASWPSADCPSGAPLNLAGQCGRLNQNYQQITEIMSRANSTYEAAMLEVSLYGHRGLSLHAHYTYAHATDWNPNESAQMAGSDVLDPADFSQEYGTSNLDIRHSITAMVIYESPWKLHNLAGNLANGWMLSGIGQFRSGLPYTMRTSGSLAKERDTSGNSIVGLGPGMNGSGGDNRVYGVGRNTFRYPAVWKADLRLARRFNLGHMRELELLAESFNLFNHENVTELETTGYIIKSGTATSQPSLNFLTGLKVNTRTGLAASAFGQPLNINATNFYRERQIQVGLRMRF